LARPQIGRAPEQHVGARRQTARFVGEDVGLGVHLGWPVAGRLPGRHARLEVRRPRGRCSAAAEARVEGRELARERLGVREARPQPVVVTEAPVAALERVDVGIRPLELRAHALALGHERGVCRRVAARPRPLRALRALRARRSGQREQRGQRRERERPSQGSSPAGHGRSVATVQRAYHGCKGLGARRGASAT